MRLLSRIAALAVAVVALAAPAPAAAQSEPFPLASNNEWTYQETGFAASPTPKVVKIDARWVSPVSGYVYYRMRGYNGDWHWVTRTSLDNVFEYGSGYWYKFRASVNAPWVFDMDSTGTHGQVACSDGARVQVLRRAEQLTVPAGTFSTIHLRWRTSCLDAGITDEWFAPGVGLVKRTQQTIGGPRHWVLQHARVSGRTIGVRPAATIAFSVAMDQADYWENHMPGPGPRPTEGPEITIRVKLLPSDGKDTKINTPDLNRFDVQVFDPSGNPVWMNPKSRAVALPQGYDLPVPGTGLEVAFSFRLPFGAAVGTYQVRAKCLATKPHPFPNEERTSFTMSRAF